MESTALVYGQVIFHKGVRLHNREKTVSSTMVLAKLDIDMRKNKVGLLCWIKDLNVNS